MHPLIITALYPPAVGGAATYFKDIVPTLARRHDSERLTVLTEHMPGQPREAIVGKIQVLRLLPNRVSGPRRPWLLHAATYALTQAWFATRLPGLVRRESIDLIHFHTRYRGRLFYDALKRLNLPVIADLRDKMTDPSRLLSIVDRLICCGEGVRRFAIEGGFPAQRTALIPIPFTPPDIPSLSQVAAVRRHYNTGETPYLLFIGDITHNKGVYDLLEAYQRWCADHPKVRLIYAGTNREEERFVAEMNHLSGVQYLGHVPHQDALALIRGAEILVLPSRSEGLPRVILEAIALGTKVICPPGIPEFERHLPEFVLPHVRTDTIVKTLNIVWSLRNSPSYPLDEHNVQQVTEALVEVYKEMEPA